jgi:prepilin-type N-terminal cleavage/methylation domain-containing protein
MTIDTARYRSENGFTLVELMIASMLTLVVMSVAFSTFENAAELNQAVVEIADQSQNLRAGTNLLIRDLLQAGRNLPTGGIAIPSGANAEAIYRPGPAGEVRTFDNTDSTTLSALTTGGALGPMVAGQATDMITILVDDPFLDALSVDASTATGSGPKLSVDGASMTVGNRTDWIAGDPDNGVAAISVGDLFYFLSPSGTTLQTVTRVDSPTIYFDADDPFNLNQRGAEAGSITQILGATMTVRRVLMYTYWVEEDDDDIPRLMRALNFFDGTALAGAIEDLTIRYDLVDGTTNPTNVENLPFELDDLTYTATQIRKVNLTVAVRSESISSRTGDYVRNRVSTVVSIRNLAFVDRYE